MSSNVINGPSCLASKAHQERKHDFTQLTRSTANSARLYSVILLPPRFKMAPVHESWDLTVSSTGSQQFSNGQSADTVSILLKGSWRRETCLAWASYAPTNMFRCTPMKVEQGTIFFPRTINDFQDVAASGRFRSNYLLLHWKKFLLQWSCWLAWQVDPFQIICTHTHTLSLRINWNACQNTLNWSFVIKLY